MSHLELEHVAIWSLRTGQPRVNEKSSDVTRTLDAIYLRPTQNQQGGHKLMDLNSGQLISRNIVHEIPVTDIVIKAIENMANQQGFKSLKFKNRNGVIYHDADWIAGVDYDDPDDIKMKMKNTTTKKTTTRTNSNTTKNSRNNSNTSILKRPKTS
jgi:hypothetical protein